MKISGVFMTGLVIVTELIPECIEELFGYLMDQEECTEKELKNLVIKYNNIKDVNYCIFITNKFFENKNK